MKRVHFVLYEPPVCGWTACNRIVGKGENYTGVSYGYVTTNTAEVTCRLCQAQIPRLTAPVPRRLPRLVDYEVPF